MFSGLYKMYLLTAQSPQSPTRASLSSSASSYPARGKRWMHEVMRAWDALQDRSYKAVRDTCPRGRRSVGAPRRQLPFHKSTCTCFLLHVTRWGWSCTAIRIATTLQPPCTPVITGRETKRYFQPPITHCNPCHVPSLGCRPTASWHGPYCLRRRHPTVHLP